MECDVPEVTEVGRKIHAVLAQDDDLAIPHYARCTEFIHYILARPVDFRRPVAIDLFEKFLVLRKDKYPRATFAHQLDQTIGVGWIAQTGENASAKRGPSQPTSRSKREFIDGLRDCPNSLISIKTVSQALKGEFEGNSA